MMKKLWLIGLTLLLVLSFAACNTDKNTNNGDDSATASESDIGSFPILSALPTYKGAGEILNPDELNDVGSFWIAGATLDDMKSYGAKLVKAKWTLKDTVEDYDPEAVLYYTSKDESQTIQLKFMGDNYIRVTVGAPEAIEGLA